jgi:hypothetical protein
MTVPSGVTKTPSSVNSAAAALASFLLYASSSFPLSSPKTASASGIPEEIALLAYLWIERVLLLSKDRQSKADCQSYERNSEGTFHCLFPRRFQ